MHKRLAIVLALAAVATLATVAVYRSGKTGEISDLVTKTLRGSNSTADKNLTTLYQNWKKQHNKTYFGAPENDKRFNAFVQNFKFYEKVNSEQKNFTLGLNKFSDLTPQEFSALYLGASKGLQVTPLGKPTTVIKGNLKGGLDWRGRGAVTGVKNQGGCGSCWAFSAVGALEGLNALAGGGLLSFSEQQLIDCSRPYGTNGCHGGWMEQAFRYTAANGITTEDRYPYRGNEGGCSYDGSMSRFRNGGVQTGSSDAWLEAVVNTRPASVALAAGNAWFQGYAGGVLSDWNCPSSIDHAVLVVGYDADQNGGYWIVKNSWGAGWGEGGYIRIRRADGAGICGINQYVQYPSQ